MDQLIKFLNKPHIVFFVVIPTLLLAPIPFGFMFCINYGKASVKIIRNINFFNYYKSDNF